jgi:signal peptide peptidase-like protein 2B
MLFAIPRIDDYAGGSSLLGLGDIVLPGLLLSFAARYDEAKKLVGASHSPRFQNQVSACSRHGGYFKPAVIAYGIGLGMANIAVYVMKMGQPALLYLVPCCLGIIVYLGWKRGELQELWNTPRVLASCDKILYGTEENESLTDNDNDNNMDGNNNEEEEGRNSTRLEIS